MRPVAGSIQQRYGVRNSASSTAPSHCGQICPYPEQIDAFALDSHRKAAAAIVKGAFIEEIVR